jgi:hypothetical protein
MKTTLIILTLLVSSVVVFARQEKAAQDKAEAPKAAAAKVEASKNPVADAVREVFARQRKNLSAAVEEMPADKFGYKPTPEQMPFGHLVAHMTAANIELCSKAGKMPLPPMHSAAETDKDKLLGLLNRSFAYCEAALARVDDSQLGDSVLIWGEKQTSVAYALIALTNDWADHYSAAANYLRMNGLLPPTAQAKK